jgi:hypothetical protein
MAFKTMKSEFVSWEETITAKKYDLHDEKQHDQPEGTFILAKYEQVVTELVENVHARCHG